MHRCHVVACRTCPFAKTAIVSYITARAFCRDQASLQSCTGYQIEDATLSVPGSSDFKHPQEDSTHHMSSRYLTSKSEHTMILRSLRVRASPAALLPLADACVLDICIKKHQPPLPLRVPKNNKAQVARARKFANSFKGCFCAAPTHQVDAFGTHATKR